MRRAMLVAAARRLLLLLCASAGITVAVSLVVGVLTGSGAGRSVSLGLYAIGCFLTVAGFFIGNRGPVRLGGRSATPLLGSRLVRWASPSEREEAINDSAVFVFLGLVLILLGIVVDSRVELV